MGLASAVAVTLAGARLGWKPAGKTVGIRRKPAATGGAAPGVLVSTAGR